jgi:hypothetical protein
VEQPKDSVSDSNAEHPKASVSNLHRSLGAYGGYTLSKPDLDRLEKIYLKPMQAASFNTIDLKLQPTNLNLTGSPDRRQALEDLVRRVREDDVPPELTTRAVAHHPPPKNSFWHSSFRTPQ